LWNKTAWFVCQFEPNDRQRRGIAERTKETRRIKVVPILAVPREGRRKKVVKDECRGKLGALTRWSKKII